VQRQQKKGKPLLDIELADPTKAVLSLTTANKRKFTCIYTTRKQVFRTFAFISLATFCSRATQSSPPPYSMIEVIKGTGKSAKAGQYCHLKGRCWFVEINSSGRLAVPTSTSLAAFDPDYDYGAEDSTTSSSSSTSVDLYDIAVEEVEPPKFGANDGTLSGLCTKFKSGGLRLFALNATSGVANNLMKQLDGEIKSDQLKPSHVLLLVLRLVEVSKKKLKKKDKDKEKGKEKDEEEKEIDTEKEKT